MGIPECSISITSCGVEFVPYHVHISQFEGPLDLLLHLIERAEVDIKDIFISEITNQYLAYMAELDGLDMDTASEFLSMAATLLYIKSRQLLPRPPKETMEEEDPEELLIRQLREYKAFKMAGEELSRLQEAMKGVYARLPEDVPLPPAEVTLSGATLQQLYQSFFTLLHTQREEPTINPLHQVRQDEFTVRSQIAKVRRLLIERKELTFEELFDERPARMEIIATFMALLEMINRGEIHLKQPSPFAPIRLSARALATTDAEDDYMDEYMD